MNATKKYWESTHEAIPMPTRTIVNEYLLSLKLANKAEATISKYCSILERFFSECTVPIDLLTSEEVINWLNEFSSDKKERTVDLVLSTLSSFFKFCIAEDYLDTMVIKKRWRPRIPQSLPKFLNEQEYARVKLASEHLSHRDRCLFCFSFPQDAVRQKFRT